MKKPEDQRRAPRVRHDSVVEIFDADGNVLIGTAKLIDYSSVGICIAGTLELEKGGRVHARVRLLREGILEIIGAVVWIRRRPVGFQYGISMESKQSMIR